ncbi:hypothetical protein V8G54_021033 [Vigna mungo]|uniref:Adenylyl-sulfate kinase n=1 Tax=Vigna mungo TaxID=3915 RepID=A0AAQ3NF24_VIGMU
MTEDLEWRVLSESEKERERKGRRKSLLLCVSTFIHCHCFLPTLSTQQHTIKPLSPSHAIPTPHSKFPSDSDTQSLFFSGRAERQKLLNQKGCVVWITGLSGSGKSTLACSLSRELYSRGKLSYVLDGDNLRHGLNKDLGFKAEERTENIRRTGEVAKLFADAGLICVASLISPYRRDRDTCRSMLPDANFIEARHHEAILIVFMNMPLELCELRDPKGLYKLARAGKIKGFTGIDDPYEPPLNCEVHVPEASKAIEIKQDGDVCPTPTVMAGQVVTYLEKEGFLEH